MATSVGELFRSTKVCAAQTCDPHAHALAGSENGRWTFLEDLGHTVWPCAYSIIFRGSTSKARASWQPAPSFDLAGLASEPEIAKKCLGDLLVVSYHKNIGSIGFNTKMVIHDLDDLGGTPMGTPQITIWSFLGPPLYR